MSRSSTVDSAMKPFVPELAFARPQVMAILNVTPDSFFAGSRTPQAEALAARVRQAVADGASILDVGGCSTRPGADAVPPDEELRRVLLGVEVCRREAPDTLVSIDTFRASVVEGVVERFGGVIVNDISAGELDPAIVGAVARHDLPYVAMHMRGTPATMQSLCDYGDVAEEVAGYFRRRIGELRAAGVRRLILDPGFGFAKTVGQNFELLAGLGRLCALGYPVLAGVSRKSMICKTLGTTPAEALPGTVALQWECLRRGAALLRVHDVREAVDTVRLHERLREAERRRGGTSGSDFRWKV